MTDDNGDDVQKQKIDAIFDRVNKHQVATDDALSVGKHDNAVKVIEDFNKLAKDYVGTWNAAIEAAVNLVGPEDKINIRKLKK